MAVKWFVLIIIGCTYLIFILTVLNINKHKNRKPIGNISKLLFGPITLAIGDRYEKGQPILSAIEIFGWSIVFALIFLIVLFGGL